MKEGVTINHYGESHFYDGATQYGDITINNPIYNKNYFSKEGEGQEDEEVEQEEQKEDVTDELFAILQDQKLYEEIVKWAKTCKKPKDIRDRIFVPLKRMGINDTSIDMIKALIPHLTNYESSKNPSTIQKQLY